MHHRVPVGHFSCGEFLPTVSEFSALIASGCLGTVEKVVT